MSVVAAERETALEPGIFEEKFSRLIEMDGKARDAVVREINDAVSADKSTARIAAELACGRIRACRGLLASQIEGMDYEVEARGTAEDFDELMKIEAGEGVSGQQLLTEDERMSLLVNQLDIVLAGFASGLGGALSADDEVLAEALDDIDESIFLAMQTAGVIGWYGNEENEEAMDRYPVLSGLPLGELKGHLEGAAHLMRSSAGIAIYHAAEGLDGQDERISKIVAKLPEEKSGKLEAQFKDKKQALKDFTSSMEHLLGSNPSFISEMFALVCARMARSAEEAGDILEQKASAMLDGSGVFGLDRGELKRTGERYHSIKAGGVAPSGSRGLENRPRF